MCGNNYLSKIDFCFCKHRKCFVSLHRKITWHPIYNDMNSSLEEKREVVVVYLDFTVPL